MEDIHFTTSSIAPGASYSPLWHLPFKPETSTVLGSGPSGVQRVSRDQEIETLVRSLASEFPLHTSSELRRTFLQAEEDLWPKKDPIDILDRARERLQEGLA